MIWCFNSYHANSFTLRISNQELLDEGFTADTQGFKKWTEKYPTYINYKLAEPYTEVIDLPREDINLERFENGSLYLSDPTVDRDEILGDSHWFVRSMTGDTVVNVSNQQFPIDLSEEAAPIFGLIEEDFSGRPKFFGKTLANVMSRINWTKFSDENRVGLLYDSTGITNKTITVTNFNSKSIYLLFNNVAVLEEVESKEVAPNSTEIIEITSDLYLSGVYGLIVDGWNSNSTHEMKNVNLFEEDLGENVPESLISGLRNMFDKDYIEDSNKYKLTMRVQNSPIMFGKGGRK